MRKRSSKAEKVRGKSPFAVAIVFVLVFFLLFSGLVFGAWKERFTPQPKWSYPLPPVNQPQSNEPKPIWQQIVEPVLKVFGISSEPSSGEEPVGLTVEYGYTSTSGESVVFSQKVLSGVGLIGMEGIWVKPNLGQLEEFV